MTTECWKPIAGYDGFYEISDHGAVRSLDRKTSDGRQVKGRVLSQSTGKYGHKSVCLYLDGLEERRCVQPMVLTAFRGPRPEGMEAAHDNGEAGDNRVDNLRWDAPIGNNADKYRHGTAPLGEKNHKAKLDTNKVSGIFQDRRDGMLVHEIADKRGVCKQHVSDILNGKRWQHLGLSL